MKNLLSENLLRFGVKNLTESQKKELIVKSIMETIDQHGLRNVIKNKLTEQAYPIYGKGEIALKPGVYTVQYPHGAKAVDSNNPDPSNFLVIPKGTKFTVDPKNPKVAYATVLVGSKWASGQMPAGYKTFDILDDQKAGALIVQLQKNAKPIQVSWSADWPETLAAKGTTKYFKMSQAMITALKKQFSTM